MIFILVTFCSTSPCGQHGTCHNLRNGYFCECFNGYSGINCDQGKTNINN